MRKYSYIWIGLVVLIFGIIVVPEIVNRIQEEDVVTSSRSDGREDRATEAQELAYVWVDDEKKKVPAFEFVDQHGDTISNEDYKGKVYVAEFFFSRCPSICPVMKENLIRLQEKFAGNDNFGIASFSIDPAHDTPQVLQEYAERTGITHPNWHLLTGEREEIYDLANSGFNIYAGEEPEAAGGFAHSGFFALVDEEGYIRSRRDQFGNPIIYYRGSVPQGAIPEPGEEEPQIKILIKDATQLLKNADQS